jgi:hypothetical protein
MASALGRRPNALAAAGTDADEALSDDCLAVCGLCLLSAQRRLDASPSSRLLVNGAACPPMMQAEFLPKHPKWSSYPPRADRRRPARSRGDQLCSFEIGRFGRNWLIQKPPANNRCCATDAFSRSPLSGPSRPFTEAILKVCSGSKPAQLIRFWWGMPLRTASKCATLVNGRSSPGCAPASPSSPSAPF